MNDAIRETAEEIRDLIAESPVYMSYLHLKEAIESNDEYIEAYRQLYEIGQRLQSDPDNTEPVEAIEIPTAVKQFIAVQKELAEIMNSVLQEMQSQIK